MFCVFVIKEKIGSNSRILFQRRTNTLGNKTKKKHVGIVLIATISTTAPDLICSLHYFKPKLLFFYYFFLKSKGLLFFFKKEKNE